MALRIISGFFAIMGTSISLIRGLLNDTLGHAYNFGFLVITHIATLEEKRQIFLLEFKRLTSELSVNALEKKAFMEQFLTNTDFVLYDQRLNALESLDSVKKYTYEVCMDLNNKYATLHTKVPFQLTDYVSVKTIVISVAVIVVLLGTFYYFTESPSISKEAVGGIKQLATDNKDITNAVLGANTTIENTLNHVTVPIVNTVEQISALSIKNAIDVGVLTPKAEVIEKTTINLYNNVAKLAINDHVTQQNMLNIGQALILQYPKSYAFVKGIFTHLNPEK